MKRCPQCEFIYLDADVVCDLDGALLVQANDNELAVDEKQEAAPAIAQSQSSMLRWFIVAAIAALVIGILIILVYVKHGSRTQPNQPLPASAQTQNDSLSQAKLEPTPIVAPSVEVSPLPIANSPGLSHVVSNRAAISRTPISTSNYSDNSGRAVIKLTNGSDIQADEVWRTKDGVWYRRSGVVTLIKNNRVRSIEKVRWK